MKRRRGGRGRLGCCRRWVHEYGGLDGVQRACVQAMQEWLVRCRWVKGLGLGLVGIAAVLSNDVGAVRQSPFQRGHER